MDEHRARMGYVQLLHLHERVLAQLHRVRSDLTAPITKQLLKTMRHRSGNAPDIMLGDVESAIEEAIRAIKLSEAQLREALLEEPREVSLEEVPNLPATLARFLAEREQLPGFSYEVLQDEVRGWVIAWKEYTSSGGVRGSGQFYERPYAWLDE
jgi:hypothetical protein